VIWSIRVVEEANVDQTSKRCRGGRLRFGGEFVDRPPRSDRSGLGDDGIEYSAKGLYPLPWRVKSARDRR
jgi:hypothetical protein